MISGKELFAEISNEQAIEDGEVVGYFVKNSRMDLLERLLSAPPAQVVNPEFTGATAVQDELLDAMDEVIRISDRDHEAWDRAKEAITACRAAMLAQPVSSGYTLAGATYAIISAIETEQERVFGEDYLMDSKDCIDVIREFLAAATDGGK